ncbi:MAG: SpoIIE family protein phosphatase [bacterium]|nr:SpoIIE family protein phosphatase [bacterium]
MTTTQALKVLVVDDEATTRLMIRANLVRESYDVISAEDGEQAVALFERERPQAVIMDLEMPVMDGYEATQEIKRMAGDLFVPVIFLTATLDEDALVRCIECGGDDFLSKPVSNPVLLAKLSAQLRIYQMTETMITQRDELRLNQIQNEQDMRIAEKVFARMVNQDTSEIGNVRKLVSPASVLSGDVLLVTTAPNGSVRVLLGDFTGHGLSAAIGTPLVCEVFYGMTAKGFSIVDVVNEMNKKLHKVLPTGLFFACVVLQLEIGEDRLTSWCGGIPDAMVRGVNGGIKHRIPSRNLALGIVGKLGANSGTTSHSLEVGDRILACSDGLAEAFNPDGELFGQKRLEKIYCEHPDSEAAFDQLSRSIADFTEGEEQTDDITMVEIVHDGRCPEKLAVGAVEKEGDLRAADWEAHFKFGVETLRAIDPLPLIVQLLAEIQGLSQHREHIYTILAELFRNSLDHGLLGLDSILKQTPDGFEKYYQLREERLAALSEGMIRIELQHEPRTTGGRLLILLEDSGPGFDYGEWENSWLSDLRAKSGRGIALVQTLCESVTYLGDGSSVCASYIWDHDGDAQGASEGT